MNKSDKQIYFNVIQIMVFIFYFYFNIINIGEEGQKIELLMFFVAITIVMFFLRSFNEEVVIKIHLLLFLMLIIWISIRVLTDKDDLDFLKQITIATTGGMFLFYCLGVALSISFYRMLYIENAFHPEWINI
ncbi:TPA: hypothetical protein ACGF8R_003561, partial [Vibrio cholerae]